MKKVLIISEDDNLKSSIKSPIKALNAELTGTAENYDQAISIIEKSHPTLIVCDISNDSSAHKAIDIIKQINQSYMIPVMYIASSADADLLTRVQETPMAGFILKPLIIKQLELTLELSLRS